MKSNIPSHDVMKGCFFLNKTLKIKKKVMDIYGHFIFKLVCYQNVFMIVDGGRGVIPKGHWSEESLVPRVVGPKGRWSEVSFVRKYT